MNFNKRKIYSLLFLGLSSAFLSQNVIASVSKDNNIDKSIVNTTKIFEDPSLNDIVLNHKQRLSNIEFEINKIQDIINQYAAFKNRIDRVVKDKENKDILLKVINEKIKTYYQVQKKYQEAKDLLIDSPSFNIRNN